MKYLCILGGGAVRGFSYIGAHKALLECGVEAIAFAGSSVGAIFSAFWAVGIPADEIEDFFLEVNFELFKDINILFGPDFAISKGGVFLDWLREHIERYYYKDNYVKGKNLPVCFKDLEKELIIIASDLTNCEPFVFSKSTTPDFEIAQAVRISASLPGLLKPVHYEEKLLSDGDLMKCMPLWRICENLYAEDTRVLEFRLEGIKRKNTVKSMADYFNTIYSCMTNYSTEFIMDMYNAKDKFDYIKIDTKDLLLVNFNITKDQKRELIQIGYDATVDFFENILPQKKLTVLAEYTKIYDYLELVRTHLLDKKILRAKMTFYEMFITLCNAKRVMDSAFYDEIMEFKTLFIDNLDKNFWQHEVLKNRNLIMTHLLLLIHKFEVKCRELAEYSSACQLRT